MSSQIFLSLWKSCQGQGQEHRAGAQRTRKKEKSKEAIQKKKFQKHDPKTQYSQHYNKVLRKKDPVELLAAGKTGKTGEAVAASTPARTITTPAKKRKAASTTPKTVVDEDEGDDDDDNQDDADLLLAATAGKGKKRSASTPKLSNLNKKARVEEAGEGEDEVDDEDDE